MKNNKLLKILIVTTILLIIAVIALFILKKSIKPMHYNVKTEDVKLVQSYKTVTNQEDLDYSIIDTITNEKEYEKFIQDNNIDRNDKLDFKYYNYKYLMVSDDILKKTHTPSQEYTDKYPKCSDTVDFYSLNNLYINLYEDPNIFLNEFINVF